MQRIHISGVCGTAMGSLAGLLKELGHTVSGSDTNFYPPMGPFLEQAGILTFTGFSEENLMAHPERGLPSADVAVIGNVCRRDNPEAVFAEKAGLERLHIADALVRFALPGTSPVVVTGTHGKTTTSSIVAHLLDASGLEPGFLIGGIVQSLGRGYRAAGKRRLHGGGTTNPRKVPFVLEGDEYDTAFWEKTAKFLHYRAEVAILTSLEHDHVDIYPTLADYRAAFERFARELPETGLLVAYAGDPEVAKVSELCRAEVAYYALEGENTHGKAPHWLAAPATISPEGITFDLYAGGVFAGRYMTPLPGLHNLRNAVAAIAVAAQAFRVPLKSLAAPLATFRGVKRRQELRGVYRGVSVYDDFAHHPTAVLETLRALRAKHPHGKLIAVFEPRSATACRKLHQQDYVSAFGPADRILLAPIGRPDLPESERLDVERLASDLRGKGAEAEALPSVERIVERIAATATDGDAVLVLSNGAFGGIFEKVESALA